MVRNGGFEVMDDGVRLIWLLLAGCLPLLALRDRMEPGRWRILAIAYVLIAVVAAIALVWRENAEVPPPSDPEAPARVA